MSDPHSPPSEPATAATERYANGRFGPGNPGRPLGAYGRASRRAALAITSHFEKHAEGVLDRTAHYNKDLYFKIISRVLPRQLDIAELESAPWTEGEAEKLLAEALDVLLAPGVDSRAALAGLSRLLDGAEPAGATVNNGD